MQTILTITDWVLFALLGFATAYLFIFALASMRRRRDRFPAARIEHRMAVLIPAYREDRVIDQSVEAILAQQYPRERYEAVVIADHCAGTARTTADPPAGSRIRKQFESQSAQLCRRTARRCG